MIVNIFQLTKYIFAFVLIIQILYYYFDHISN